MTLREQSGMLGIDRQAAHTDIKKTPLLLRWSFGVDIVQDLTEEDDTSDNARCVGRHEQSEYEDVR